jgi:hypothetical protein
MSTEPGAEAERWIRPADARRALAEGTGAGVRIAVLDTGIEAAHPGFGDLQLRDDLIVTVEGGQVRVSEGEGQDVYGHGTAVAGIIRALAPEAEIGSFRILGTFKESRSSVVRAGVRQAISRGYHILNCSFGCPGRPEFLMSFKSWVDKAYMEDVHIVTACNNVDFSTPEWPAHFPSVIAVGGIEGDPDEVYFRKGELVEFGALGQEAKALWPNGENRSVLGSSFAAARISGLLARLLSVYPDLPPLLAKSMFREVGRTWPD